MPAFLCSAVLNTERLNMSNTGTRPVPSPCVSVCALGEGDICIACHRSGDEIRRWGSMSDEEKRAVWVRIRQRERDQAL